MNSFSEDDAFEAAARPLSQQAMARPKVRDPEAYLSVLNAPQREAVEALDGPVLMLAGAGTGKTRALMARVAHLENVGGVSPRNILAVTFTNKAAREMKQRLALQPYDMDEPLPWLGTFHAVCAKQLRRHAELVGLKSNFTILDTDDQIRLMKQLIEAADIDHKRWPARMLAGIIDGWKNKALTPDKIPVADSGAFDQKGVALYAAYQRRLRDLNAVDFGDILLHMVTIFQTHADVLAQYQRWFRYILVDEYQDTNVAQ
ncbi:UvrD-helicase domain-containing protein, partial [Yoonia sp.]|uniref:ATP-dependent helicase n=1 Tax=Yoonia sp. TaxID=2212373 RepID=UPI0025F73283